MSVIGIVSEFNPFHNGHKYLIDSVKKDGDGVVCVMSGNFVQRCEPAVLEKRMRAKQALLCGADLVLELPVAYCLSGAQTFAKGGVSLLDSLGTVNTLAFGSECGDVSKLTDLAEKLKNTQVQNGISELLKTGITYASARQRAVENLYGSELACVLRSPNDILAVEYIGALNGLNSEIKPGAVLRKGAGHDENEPCGTFAGASYIRKKIKDGEKFEKYMPESSFGILAQALKDSAAPSEYRKLDIAVLSFLRMAGGENFRDTPDVSEGIENRILNAAKDAHTLAQVFENAKTKRYTHSRIRRIVLCAFLGIKKSDTAALPPYLRVLGFNGKGREILKNSKSASKLPVVMRSSDISPLGGDAERCFELECRATDIYNLTLPVIRPCGTEMTDNIAFT